MFSGGVFGPGITPKHNKFSKRTRIWGGKALMTLMTGQHFWFLPLNGTKPSVDIPKAVSVTKAENS